MKIGYARVSTNDQTLEPQTDALADAGCEKLFSDVASGARTHRPGLDHAIAFCRQGDTLKETIAMAKTLLTDKNLSVKQICDRLGMAKSTLYMHAGPSSKIA